ncbi:7-carboxy-7-deazaguanine synthase [Stutzerimonas xanthomarina]|uniref:7-carboxy-7-deazaguanine synthase n=3 Tax=Stutzerimonas xanthomarina TaxID=271420 RepID=A0A1M5P8R0_9GAMM|nr:7-carboxy-7-deazaguanine synthase [Stutzerimonas xanthomarina]SHG98097.1 7-carboxy-7-deazaguanine synthase [Stutzerimonas xanthomarina DSM 18231]
MLHVKPAPSAGFSLESHPLYTTEADGLFSCHARGAMQHTLRISEIFYSLQGETRTSGLPTVFVRLTGCPLRCQYCDTAYAFNGGEVIPLDVIVARIAAYRPRYVCVTGGEPLAQPNCIPLLERLCDAGYEVSLETSGALDISMTDVRVSRVVDLKTPDSAEMARNRYENIGQLTKNDQVKFVLCSREDYDWAVSKLIEYRLDARAGEVLFSPSHGQLDARALADWIVSDNLPVRLQLQLHKILWNDAPGH